MMSSVAGAFGSEHPLATMTVRMEGTSDGVGLFCDGLAAVTGASRPLNDRERANCAASHIKYVRLHVADDAVVVFTADDQSLPQCLTSQQIYSLMGPESMPVDTWQGASGVISGTGDGLPPTALSVYGPDAGSGTRQVLIDLIISPLAKERGMVPTLRSDYNAVPSEQLIPTATASAGGGLGFTGMAILSQSDQKVRPVAIDNGSGCVTPTVAHVRDGTYALGRPLYVYVNLADVARNATLQQFVGTVLAPGGLAAAGTTGGIALAPAEADAVRAHWNHAVESGKGDTA